MTTAPTFPWPRALPKVYRAHARLSEGWTDRMNPCSRLDALAVERALWREHLAPRATGVTANYDETFFVNSADFSALASSAAEGSLLAGLNNQPVVPAQHFLRGPLRGFSLDAMGVFSNTGTPTLTFQVRLGETAGSSFLSGTSVAVSAAITTASGVTNKWWRLHLELVCRTQGIGTGNATLAGAGFVESPTGFASPFLYPLEPTTPDTATWTSTINAALVQYVNLSATWSASSASNTITCKHLVAKAW